MSLINQMLKDLDERREESARGRLHREVRPLPAAASPGHGRWLVPAVVVVLIALLGGWFYQQQSMVPVASAPLPPRWLHLCPPRRRSIPCLNQVLRRFRGLPPRMRECRWMTKAA